MSQSRVALVTGGTSGIGEATAKAFAASGWSVVIAGRRADKGKAVVDAIVAKSGKAIFVPTDVTKDDDLKRLVAKTVEKYGRLDAAFNNAGIEGDLFVPVHQQSADNYKKVFDTNVRSILIIMEHEIPALLSSGGGAIVNNASVAGVVGFPGMSVYTASKHAVIGLTRNVALEYAKQGLRANVVAPGPIETEMYDRFANDEVRAKINASVPMGRSGTAEEIASAVLWLSDPENSYTTGQVIAVDGGYTAQ